MELPDEVRDDHCKHVLQRFETVIDRFRKTATITAVATLAFFVIFFIPYIRLGHTKSALRQSQRANEDAFADRRAAFEAQKQQLEARRLNVRQKEHMLARVQACKLASEDLKQLRRDVTGDFTLPLEVPTLSELPSELRGERPFTEAPWNVDQGSGRHLDRIDHYRVMLAILNRLSVHEAFLENRIFGPVLAEIDGASRFRTRQQAEEIRAALTRLKEKVRAKFEEPLEDPDAGQPPGFGLWNRYDREAGDTESRFSALLAAALRGELRTEAEDVIAMIQRLVSHAPWEPAASEAWKALGLEDEILREVQALDLTDENFQPVLKTLGLEGSGESINDQLDTITSSTQELQRVLEAQGVDIWQLAGELVGAYRSEETTETLRATSDDSTSRMAAAVKADSERRLEETLPVELEAEQAAIKAEERQAELAKNQAVEQLREQENALREKLKKAGEAIGGLALSLEDTILLFPVLLAAGFLICCAQFAEVARLRDIYGELTNQGPGSQSAIVLACVLPFPLADAENRLLRWIALAFPILFQIAALVLLIVFWGFLGDESAGVVMAYLLAFLVGVSGMAWGALYAATALHKPANPEDRESTPAAGEQ